MMSILYFLKISSEIWWFSVSWRGSLSVSNEVFFYQLKKEKILLFTKNCL